MFLFIFIFINVNGAQFFNFRIMIKKSCVYKFGVAGEFFLHFFNYKYTVDDMKIPKFFIALLSGMKCKNNALINSRYVMITGYNTFEYF